MALLNQVHCQLEVYHAENLPVNILLYLSDGTMHNYYSYMKYGRFIR